MHTVIEFVYHGRLEIPNVRAEDRPPRLDRCGLGFGVEGSGSGGCVLGGRVQGARPRD